MVREDDDEVDDDGLFDRRSLPPPAIHKKQNRAQLTVTAKGQFAVHLIAEVKREHLTRHRALVDGILEHGLGIAQCKSLEPQTQYPIELAHDVSYAQSAGIVDLGELLTGYDDVVRERHGIEGEEAVHIAAAVLDVKVGPVHLVARRFGIVVLGLAAVDEPVAAILAIDLGHPQVRRAGVEYDRELLRRTSDLDGSVVLRVGIILDDHVLRLGLVHGGGGGDCGGCHRGLLHESRLEG